MIKRVRLDYKPVAKRTSEEAAFVVSAEHVAAVNRSIGFAGFLFFVWSGMEEKKKEKE